MTTQRHRLVLQKGAGLANRRTKRPWSTVKCVEAGRVLRVQLGSIDGRREGAVIIIVNSMQASAGLTLRHRAGHQGFIFTEVSPNNVQRWKQSAGCVMRGVACWHSWRGGRWGWGWGGGWTEVGEGQSQVGDPLEQRKGEKKRDSRRVWVGSAHKPCSVALRINENCKLFFFYVW